MSNAYLIEFRGEKFSPLGKIDDVVDIGEHNYDLEVAQLAAWAASPDHGDVYVKGNKVVSFLGTPMGDIVKRRTYKSNFGARIEAITVLGTNGSLYNGRYGTDNNEFCVIRKRKTKRMQGYRKRR